MGLIKTDLFTAEQNRIAALAKVLGHPARIAILPMGLCYPGVDAKGGDRPPRPVCAPTWHPRFLPLLSELDDGRVAVYTFPWGITEAIMRRLRSTAW